MTISTNIRGLHMFVYYHQAHNSAPKPTIVIEDYIFRICQICCLIRVVVFVNHELTLVSYLFTGAGQC